MATVVKDFKIKSGLLVEGTTGKINNFDILTKKQADQDYIVSLIGGTSTSANTPDTVVKRDGSGNFAANEITAEKVIIGEAGWLEDDDDIEIHATEGNDIRLYANTNGGSGDVRLYAGDDIVLYANDAIRIEGPNIRLEGPNIYAGENLNFVDGERVVVRDYLAGELANYTTTANLDAEVDGLGYLKSADLTGYALETYVDTAEADAIAAAALDATTKANAAYSNAEIYTDGQIDALESSLQDYADQAETDAKAYTDTRETAITSAYQAYADAAEQDAKDYADGLIDDASASSANVWSAYKTQTEIGLAQQAAEDYADTAIANLVGSAPATLDTLQELADALQDNPNIIDSLQDVAAGKQDELTAGNGIVIDDDLIYVPTYIGSGISVTPTEVEIDRATVDTWYDENGAAANAQTAAETFATTAANNAQDAAEAYADGLAVNYDPAGSASAAQTAAEAFATTVANNAEAEAISTASADATTKADAAELNAKNYADGLVSDLQDAVDDLNTDDVAEGALNKYYSTTQAKADAAALLVGATKTNIQITGDENGLTITAENGVADSTTSDLAEGSRLYFTDARAVSALQNTDSVFNTVSIDDVALQVAATLSAPTAGIQSAYTWNSEDYTSAEFLVKVAYGTHTEVSKVLLTLDTSDNVAITEYGIVGTNGSASTISASVSAGVVSLDVTTVNNNSTVTVVGTLLV